MEKYKNTQMAKFINEIDSEIQNIQNVLSNYDDFKNLQDTQKSSRAFLTLCTMIINSIDDPQDAYEYVCDGSNDGGIDSLYYDETTKTLNIISAKYHVNDKNENGVQTNDFQITLNTANEILYTKKSVYNKKLEELKNNIKDVKSTKVFYCYNDCDKKNHSDLCNQFNAREKIQGIIYDIFILRDEYNKWIKPEKINYTYNALQWIQSPQNNKSLDSLLQQTTGRIPTFTFFISYQKFTEFLKNYSESNNIETLFADNIRLYHGITNNSVNKSILQTIQDEEKRKYFSVLNNGITIICDYVDVQNSGIEIRNPQIINGLQTTMTLWNVYCEKLIDHTAQFPILIRLYERTEQAIKSGIIDDIIAATNNQTPVKTVDQMANEEFSISLERFFNNYNYVYKRKRGGVSTRGNVFIAENALKWWHALYHPLESKNKKSEIVYWIYDKLKNNIASGRPNIDSNFADDNFNTDVLIACILTKLIPSQRSRIKNNEELYSQYDFVSHCDEMVIYCIYDILTKRYKTNRSGILNFLLQKPTIDNVYEQVLAIIRISLQSLATEKVVKANYTNTFKNNTTLFNTIKEHLNPPQ